MANDIEAAVDDILFPLKMAHESGTVDDFDKAYADARARLLSRAALAAPATTCPECAARKPDDGDWWARHVLKSTDLASLKSIAEGWPMTRPATTCHGECDTPPPGRCSTGCAPDERAAPASGAVEAAARDVLAAYDALVGGRPVPSYGAIDRLRAALAAADAVKAATAPTSLPDLAVCTVRRCEADGCTAHGLTPSPTWRCVLHLAAPPPNPAP